jgi:hypothetical protein
MPCPTCGTTRAVDALWHGDVLSALGFNPLATVSLALFVIGGIVAPAWIHARRTTPVMTGTLPLKWRTFMVSAFLANWALVVVRGT